MKIFSMDVREAGATDVSVPAGNSIYYFVE